MENSIEYEPEPLEEHKNEIEESIIEEEIASNQVPRPATPLITSKTKGKGKMALQMMKPPKPMVRQNSPSKEKVPIPSHLNTINNSEGDHEYMNNSIKEELTHEIKEYGGKVNIKH